MPYFPRFTEPYQRRISERDWDHRGPSAFRKLTFSLIDMAFITGVVLRLGRAALLSNAPPSGGALFVGGFFVGALFLFAMTTVHLGNFPVRHWIWRAPAFAALEAVVEMTVSLVLIAMGREPYGTARASYADWPAMAAGVLTWRFVAIATFAVILAAVVQWARVTTLRREHRL